MSQYPVNCCAACGNYDIRRVTAIVQEGSWSEQSAGSSVGLGHVFGGPNFVTGSVSARQTQGATGLAQMLAPPPSPVMRVNGNAGCLGAVMLSLSAAGFIVSFCWFLSLKEGRDASLVPLILSALFTLGTLLLGIGSFQVERQNNIRAREQHAANTHYWQLAMHRWQQVFYCPKCDSVFHWQERVPVPSHSLASIVYPALPHNVQ